MTIALEVNCKPAAAADSDLLISMMRGLYEHDQLEFDEQAARGGLTQLLGDEALGRVWLIEVDGAPAGYVVLTYGFSLEYHGRDALIDEFFIAESLRGRGVGQQTLEFVAAFCRAQGIRAIHLAVDYKNERAQHVYRQFGFAAQERFLMTRWLAKSDKSDKEE